MRGEHVAVEPACPFILPVQITETTSRDPFIYTHWLQLRCGGP